MFQNSPPNPPHRIVPPWKDDAQLSHGGVVERPVANSPLSTILQRLERVEEHVTSLRPLPSSPEANSNSDSVDGELPQRTKAPQDAVCLNGSTSSSPASAASPSVLSTPTCGSGYPLGDLDIASVLMEAIGQVQRLRLQDMAKSTLAAGITIPPQLAKGWIHNYFTHMRADAFLSLIDAKLIMLIPDIIDFPQVHLDAALLVVYYGVLYHGCSLPASLTNNVDHTNYARQIYLCCLRSLPSWQREATGTTTDFIAAMFMARAAAECFDYDLSWQLFKQSCEYAHGLNMHNLDSGDDFSFSSDSKGDADRKGFWELIQVELFFRLLYNRPPAFTESMSSWRVNLPWLSSGSQPDMDEVPTLTFLVSSRITLVLTQFFQLLEVKASHEDILPKVEFLCEEIEELFRDWQVEEWLQKAQDNDVDSWMLIDVTLTGYTTIIFMLRKCNILESSSPSPVSSDQDVPRSPLAVSASRHILSIIYRLLVRVPSSETVSILVGFFQVFIPYACLASNIVRSPNPSALASDLELLERIGENISVLSRKERDFTPLARALRGINGEIRKCVEQDSSESLA
ncbi:hypothetical protein AK830_g2139 [Neonectria ditissima]|uniref:Transcription factor domain-containing protein n=1 Tax=Neonectria ditissima TaxID=78410 RepID=A0A0P7BSX1_9HYPO|nr:hypothetical protein AK830_g2139 [Neonectria ditissima]